MKAGFSLVESIIGLAIGLGAVALVLSLTTLYGKPADRREKVREAKVMLGIALEQVVRRVRDGEAVEEAVGPTMLVRTVEGASDLFCFRQDTGELVVVEDADLTGPAPPVEKILASGLTAASFTDPDPLGGLIAGETVRLVLEAKVGEETVRAVTLVGCRNRGLQCTWR